MDHTSAKYWIRPDFLVAILVFSLPVIILFYMVPYFALCSQDATLGYYELELVNQRIEHDIEFSHEF